MRLYGRYWFLASLARLYFGCFFSQAGLGYLTLFDIVLRIRRLGLTIIIVVGRLGPVILNAVTALVRTLS